MHYSFIFQGNLAYDPTVTQTKRGQVVQLRVLRSIRFQRDGKWMNGQTMGVDVTCWRELATNVAALGLRKGDTVTVVAGEDLRAEAFGDRVRLRVSAVDVSAANRFARRDRPAAEPARPAAIESDETSEAIEALDGELVDA